MRQHSSIIPAACLVLFCAVFTTGCITSVGPGAIAGPTIGRSVVYPDFIQPNKSNIIQYTPETIEIVGWVQNRRNSSSFQWRFPLLGNRSVISLKSSDYGSAVRELREEHQIDGLLNRTIDTRRFVINFIFGRYSDYQTIIGGVGFRFRDQMVAERPEKPVMELDQPESNSATNAPTADDDGR